MSGPPEISVVMANRNGARHLGEAIQSLQAQTLRSWELLFVDDASSDDSVACVEKISADDARIRVFRQTTQKGAGAARNRALALARGSWIAIMDSDDRMSPRRLARLRARAVHDGARIVADDLLLFSEFDGKQRPLLNRTEARWIGLAEFVDGNCGRLRDLGYLKPFFAAELLNEAGTRYDETLRIGEDYDFLAHLLARGEKFRLEPEALYLYRRHTGSTSHRMTGSDIAALIAAGGRFERRLICPSVELTRALRRRRRALETLALFDRAIGIMKSRRYDVAAITIVNAPQIWPLLARPLRARLARVVHGQSRTRHHLQHAPLAKT